MNITKITPISFKGVYRPNNTSEDDLKRVEQDLKLAKSLPPVVPENKPDGKLNLENRLYYLV